MSDTETPTHDGEPQHTTEGLEVIENLRTFNEGDEVTIRTDEELFTGRIEWIDASEHEHVVSIDVSDSEQIRQHTDRDDIRLHIFASGGLGDGWFVPTALVRVGHIDEKDLGRVRSVSRPDDSNDESEADSDDSDDGEKTTANVFDQLGL
jgi:hypothetical protein